MLVIDSFRGQYRFLSNFFLSPIDLDGVYFPTAEHAYQFLKTVRREDQQRIIACKTPGEAKREGQLVQLRPDWERIKVQSMKRVVTLKFGQNQSLADLLLATKNSLLIEGNNWGDTFWGKVNGRGENHLGRILMDIRSELFGRKR